LIVKPLDARNGKKLRIEDRMGRLAKQMFAFFASTLPANINPSEGVEREPLERSAAADPAEIAAWGKGRINDAAWSPIGELLAVGSAIGVAIYNRQSIEPICQIATTTPIQQVAFLGESELIATAADDAVSLWPMDDNTPLRKVIPHAQAPVSVAFSANAELVAVDTGAAINIHSVREGALLCSLPTATVGSAGCMAFAPDSQSIAVATGCLVQLWQLDRPELISTFGAGVNQVGPLAFAADGQTLITVSDREIRLWNVSDGALLRILISDLANVRRITISPDGRILAAAADSGIHLWRTEDGLLLRVLASLQARTLSLAFDPDSQNLMAAAGDALQIWRVHDGTEIYHLSGHWDSITSVAIAPDGHTFAAMAEEATLWHMSNGGDTFLHSFQVERRAGPASGIAFSPNSKYIALATDAQVQIRRVRDGSQVAMLAGGLAQGDGLVFSDDGQNVLTVSLDAVQIWRVRDGRLLQTLDTCTAGAYAITPAPDGQTLATVTDRAIQIWRVYDQRLIGSLHVDLDINGIALARQGRMLAVASDDAIQLWQVDPINLIEQQYTIEGRAQRVVFANNGELLASTWNSTVQIWNVRNGALLHTFTGHTDTVHSMAFSHDARMLISGSHDGTVRLWKCTPEA
jgi:WD40 repeat protein